MSDPKASPAAPATDKIAAMTAAEAAKRVKRPVTSVVVEDGKPKRDEAGALVTETKLKPVGASEVLAFRDYGDRVVVVTVDGQKFDSAAEAV